MRLKRIGLALLGLVLFIIVGSIIPGGVLTASVRQAIGEPPADIHARLLTWQLRPRLGVQSSKLRPIDHVGTPIPKLFIAGAAGPKEMRIVNGAAHVDLHAAHKIEYEQRVTSFFQSYLR